jgi:hypothetical protein
VKQNNPETPTAANYRILELIEQIVKAAPKGTFLILLYLTIIRCYSDNDYYQNRVFG